MEGKRLKVLNLQMNDMARQIENAIQFGNPVLLQDVLEEIDPVLEPVLAKVIDGCVRSALMSVSRSALISPTLSHAPPRWLVCPNSLNGQTCCQL